MVFLVRTFNGQNVFIVVWSRNADTPNLALPCVQEERFWNDTVSDTFGLGYLIPIGAFTHTTLWSDEAEVRAASVVFGTGIGPLGIRLGVDRLDTHHEAVLVVGQHLIVFPRQFVCSFDGLLFPVCPVDVVAENTQAERMIQAFLDEYASSRAVGVDQLDAVVLGVAEVQVLQLHVQGDAVRPANFF